ncbi:Asp-tRNA(Asn)/Glu-tRNA(Gln) amidotransferase subunit GatB [Fervidicoccus fontis]|uniref:Aspartyl/glutamyl-tRNA(Asn/Gln) amidotransferase subunit B n=1 Tax=Fervidicoccus fontis TaxID=683846 RepID=A0A7C2ZAB2_9CREN|nr:Asp-tRNA(Asn)/Glu-tRNA(Gln) amidotransferase subunit GatB [Fervidicoccus fontis]HEW63915.1 Asp-tRNA(Asn)/Glu-tRNA(Gln) amidotransferase subunit GatB [Fervidicoccus fontis]
MSKNDVMIGLEIHVQMTSLKTKLFCGCSSDYRNSPPNTNVCPVCLGLPGSLPMINKKAVEKAIQVAIALNMEISKTLSWTRKHYFYPDLPKNYQITQYDGKGVSTIAKNGYVSYTVNGNSYVARIRRINIEEDPGKILYPSGSMITSDYILIDYNRSGIALLEIVTEPDFKTHQQVSSFLKKLRSILEHLGIADFSLEGSMRVDVNISIGGGKRVELKNISSIAEIENAIVYEITRQRTLLNLGREVEMETRHWDQERKVTFATRAKETEEDYRYFPDPNLPSIEISEELVKKIRESLPELPDKRKERFIKDYKLSEYIASVLVSDKKLSDYFEEVMKSTSIDTQKAASFIVNDVLGWIPSGDTNELNKYIPPQKIAELLEMLREGKITIKMAKELIPELINGKSLKGAVEEKGWFEVIYSEEEILKVIESIMNEYPEAVKDSIKDKKAIQFLVGKVLEATNKRADPKKVYDLICKKIEKISSKLQEDL